MIAPRKPAPKKPAGPVPLQLVPQLVAGIVRLARSGTRRGNRSTLRDGLAILLGLHGLRIRETSNALVGDLRLDAQALWVRTLKGGRNRCVPLAPSAQELAREIAATAASPQDYLCRTRSGRPVNTRDLRRRWDRWCAQILGTHYRFHDLRHTFARVLSSTNGAGILAAQDALGHRKLDTTRRYVVDRDAVISALATHLEPTRDLAAAAVPATLPPLQAADLAALLTTLSVEQRNQLVARLLATPTPAPAGKA